MVDIRDKEKMEAVLIKYKEQLQKEFPNYGVAVFVYEIQPDKSNYISYVTSTTSEFLFYLLDMLIEQRKLLAKKFTTKQ